MGFTWTELFSENLTGLTESSFLVPNRIQFSITGFSHNSTEACSIVVWRLLIIFLFYSIYNDSLILSLLSAFSERLLGSFCNSLIYRCRIRFHFGGPCGLHFSWICSSCFWISWFWRSIILLGSVSFSLFRVWILAFASQGRHNSSRIWQKLFQAKNQAFLWLQSYFSFVGNSGLQRGYDCLKYCISPY